MRPGNVVIAAILLRIGGTREIIPRVPWWESWFDEQYLLTALRLLDL
jgi:hypothetical protein